MALHQYIGARYVPIYYQNSLDPTSTEWEPNVNYEALTVVTLPNQHSYISKKSVPDTIGSPALNAEYWLDTGSDNAYIHDLNERVDKISADISTEFDSTVSYSEGDLVTHEDVLYVFNVNHTGAWDDNDVSMVNLASMFNTMNQKINDIKKRVILVIGNSYIGRGVADLTAECFDREYHVGGDGSGFLTYTNHNSTFLDQIATAIADPNIDNNEITDILFVSAMGDTRAANERGATTFRVDLTNAFNTLKDTISTNFPNVTRTVVTLAESRDIPYFANNKLSDMFLVHRTFADICTHGFMDYIGWSGFAALYDPNCFESDHYHPNTNYGAHVIGSWIRNAYFGNATYRKLHGVCNNLPIKYAADSVMLLVYDMTPDLVEFQIRRINSTNGAAVTLAAGNTGIINWSNESYPIPAPANDCYVYTALYGVLTASGMGYGQQLDYLSLIATGDSYGQFNLTNNEAPTASTAKQRCIANEFIEYTYIP